MHGICFENPLQEWFEFKIPKTTIHPDYIHDCLLEEDHFSTKPMLKLFGQERKPLVEFFTKSKKEILGKWQHLPSMKRPMFLVSI